MNAELSVVDKPRGVFQATVNYPGTKLLKPAIFSLDIQLTQNTEDDEKVFVNFKQTDGKPEAQFYSFVNTIKTIVR